MSKLGGWRYSEAEDQKKPTFDTVVQDGTLELLKHQISPTVIILNGSGLALMQEALDEYGTIQIIDGYIGNYQGLPVMYNAKMRQTLAIHGVRHK